MTKPSPVPRSTTALKVPCNPKAPTHGDLHESSVFATRPSLAMPTRMMGRKVGARTTHRARMTARGAHVQQHHRFGMSGGTVSPPFRLLIAARGVPVTRPSPATACARSAAAGSPRAGGPQGRPQTAQGHDHQPGHAHTQEHGHVERHRGPPRRDGAQQRQHGADGAHAKPPARRP